MCGAVDEGGALSLRSATPFSIAGAVLRLDVAGGGGSGSLGDLELQLESQQAGAYLVSRPLTLRDLAAAQPSSDPAAALARMQAGEFAPLVVPLSAFGPLDKADRLTLGCLQAGAACQGATFCIGSMSIESA